MAPDWLPLPGDWNYPQLLLGALVLSIVVTGLVAAGTSSAAFGAYNPAWDGAAGLADEADAVDSDVVRALNTTAYLSTPGEGTVAVVLAPDEPYDELDVARIRSFLQRGGTLVVAEDYGRPGNRLLADLGARSRVDGAPLRDEREYHRAPALPVATNVTESGTSETNATAGVDQLTLNHGSVVTTNASDGPTNASDENATVLVRSSEFAYLDRNENGELDDDESMERYPIVVREEVGNGTVYVVSDPSLFINAMLDRPDNRRFVRNLFGAGDRVLLDLSHQSNQPPLALALLVLRDAPSLQVLLGLLGVLVVLGTPNARDRLSRWRERRDRDVVDESGQVDRAALVRHLERTHPDWDDRRVRRVMTGVLDRPHDGRDDD